MSGLENIYKHWLNRQLNVFEPANKVLPQEIKSVWLVKDGGVGDVLLMTPLPRLIKAKWSQAKVTVVVNQMNVPVWEYNPYVDRVLSTKSRRVKLTELGRISKIGRSEGVDLIISSEVYKGSIFFCKWCKPKIAIGMQVPQLPDDYWSFPIKEERIHRTELLKNMAIAAGLDLSDWRQEIYWPQAVEDTAEKLFYPVNRPCIGFAPWSINPQKSWPLELVVEFCNIMKQKNYQLVLLGGKAEREYAERLEERIGQGIVNLVGKTSFLELAAILKNLNLLVSCDTGTAHLAATVDCAAIVLFGPSSASIWKPYSKKVKAIEGKRCSGCNPSQHRFGWQIGSCVRPEYECMNIAPEYISELVEDYFKKSSMDE